MSILTHEDMNEIAFMLEFGVSPIPRDVAAAQVAQHLHDLSREERKLQQDGEQRLADQVHKHFVAARNCAHANGFTKA